MLRPLRDQLDGIVAIRSSASINPCSRAARSVLADALAILTVLIVIAAPNNASAQSCVGTIGPCFQGLGFVTSNVSPHSSTALGVSPDGATVVGTSTFSSSSTEAFSWNGGTITGLGFLAQPGGIGDSYANAVNSQGVIVGYSSAIVTGGGSSNEAFEYSNGSMAGLGFLCTSSGVCESSIANAISANASVVAGLSYTGTANEAVEFSNGVVTPLGVLPNGSTSQATAVDANGEVIVGFSTYNSGNSQDEAFVWQNGTMFALPFLKQTDTSGQALAVNATGSIAAGISGSEAVRWVNGLATDLGVSGTPHAISASGNVVVGVGTIVGNAFRWTPVDGVKSIGSLLSAAGVTTMAQWTLENATGISADGVTIVGNGIDPSGNLQGWIARLPIPPALALTHDTHDFNGDGKSDILFRNTGASPTTVAMWLMNAGSILSAGSVATVPTSYSIVGQRDFNGDGNADLLWRDTGGNLYMWLMNGLTMSSSAGLGNVPPTWTVMGTGDMNGDGIGDLLWQDSAGDLAIWFMNGATVSSTTPLGTVAPSSGWSIAWATTGQILWRNTSGAMALWQVNGSTVQATNLGSVPSNWVVQGMGDFNGDGVADILWRDTSAGTVAVWFLNSSGGVQSSASVATVPISANWSIVQTGDYNGDGMSDMLWTDASGDLAIWLMNGSTISSTAGLGNIGTSWTVQSLNAE